MESSIELTTKERIIESAIELFSEKGFFETSVRELAERSNIKVSSLYSHFTSKEEILDVILESYRKELTKVRIPDEKLEFIVNNLSPEEIFTRGFSKIIETTASQKMNKIIKILLMELYRNPKVRDFYKQWYFNENRVSVIKIFQKLQEKGTIKKYDLELLASMYNALLNYYYHEFFLYIAENKDTLELEDKIKQHLQLFIGLLK
jgi:AcrR family transcriptional regulator